LDLNDHIILHSDNHRLQHIRRSVCCLSDPQIPQVSCYRGGLADWQDACELVESEAIGSPHCDSGWFVMIGRWQQRSAPTVQSLQQQEMEGLYASGESRMR
jgi:hypothetical protein